MITQLPLIEPVSSWECPSGFPDLSKAKYLSIDLETRDPKLKTHGPGTIRKDGYPIGIAVACDGFSAYFPTRHGGGGNIDEEMVYRWLGVQLRSQCPKIGANIIYDLEWLRSYRGIAVEGPIWDVQIAEPILDEESELGYSLDVLSKKYLKRGKDESLLNDACYAWGIEDTKGGLWQLHPRFVGPYAEADAVQALEIFLIQKKLLEDQGLWPIFELESQLVPLLLEMRFKGVRVDEEKAKVLSEKWLTEQNNHQSTLDTISGRKDFDAWSGDEILKVCNAKNLGYGKTEKGNPSFTGPWLKTQYHEPFFKALHEWRSIQRMREVYVDGLMKYAVKGRIHCQFHPLRKDEEGTRSGRFSSTAPNLQQVPSRDEELAPLVRSLFLPDEGASWCKLDYSQQEPRVLVHYAFRRGFDGASKIRDAYIEDPKMDYYKMISSVAKISRHDAKQVSLALFYGMGIGLLAYNLNRGVDEAKEIYDQYNSYVPFVKQLSKECSLVAGTRGFIKTILGRHRHFNLWEPVDRDFKTETGAYNLAEAKKRWPNRRLRRAFTHKSLNALVQGSSADMTKLAMLTMWKEKKIIPHLTVHDEIDHSIFHMEEAYWMKSCMESVIKLEVPIVAELSTGPSWGQQSK